MQKFLEKVKENPKILKAINQGVEKEGLRCDSTLKASMKNHPKSLGSKLTHPYITTDYSENLMEFISPVFSDCTEMFFFLRELFSFTYKNLDKDEVIWPASMPCLLPENEMDIPVANYGESNIGKLKTLYRIGLGHRYGKSMQSIAGIHYNFSLSDNFWKEFQEFENDQRDFQEYKNDKYFHLIRNYRRYSWLLIYLFGSSPAVDESFLKNKKHKLKKIGKNTFGLPYATSLRMGGLGYTSNAQKEISVCYNKLSTYIDTLENARLKAYPAYEKIGLKDDNGHKQLNTNLLQIDNEFYSALRPKRTALSKESALQALHRRGVEYLEVRLLDVDPFSDTGISQETVKFLHNFLLGCLFMDSSHITDEECNEIDNNLAIVVNEGRRPGVKIYRNRESIDLQTFALDLLDEINCITHQLDIAYGSNIYSKALNIQKQKILHPELTPSARLLENVSEEKSVIEFIYELALRYKEIHVEIPLEDKLAKKWEELTIKSFAEQNKIESDDKLSFDEFLDEYFKNIKIES